MKYAIIVHESKNDFERREHSDESIKQAYWGAFSAYHQALSEAGVFAGGEGLQGPDPRISDSWLFEALFSS